MTDTSRYFVVAMGTLTPRDRQEETMKKYRKKPIVIDAVQITEDTFAAPHPNKDHVVGIVYDPVLKEARIRTLEGVMTGNLGDWIICGIKGEFYPCKSDIFEATYEPVE